MTSWDPAYLARDSIPTLCREASPTTLDLTHVCLSPQTLSVTLQQHTRHCWWPKTLTCSRRTKNASVTETLTCGGLCMTGACSCCCPSCCASIRCLPQGHRATARLQGHHGVKGMALLEFLQKCPLPSPGVAKVPDAHLHCSPGG